MRGVMELMNSEPLGLVFVEFCFAIPSSESTIVSAVELVWKAMELLQLDEDRILRAELSLEEALLSGHCNRKKRTGRAEVLIPPEEVLYQV